MASRPTGNLAERLIPDSAVETKLVNEKQIFRRKDKASNLAVEDSRAALWGTALDP
ncbi:MAG TPA: hypothetical protein VNN13_08375 [Methylomirabilota bacterium]|nr:hypothetical protein [Methylomirabilota bacterium]